MTATPYSPNELRYAPSHEWVHLDSEPGGAKVATVGLSAFAVAALTDLAYIDLPAVGTKVSAGKSFGEIESVKSVNDLYSPADGEVIEVNEALRDKLEILAQDPYGEGWLVRVRVSGEKYRPDLMDEAAYARQCAAEEH